MNKGLLRFRAGLVQQDWLIGEIQWIAHGQSLFVPESGLIEALV